MATIIANMTSLQVHGREMLTTGNINSLEVRFEYASGWDNLIKTAVFVNGDNSISILLNADTCTIPWEVLRSEGELYISLRGTDLSGKYVICTENAFIGTVTKSLATAVAAEHHEATPDAFAVLFAAIAELNERINAVSSRQEEISDIDTLVGSGVIV